MPKLAIWTKDYQSKVRDSLQGVLSLYPEVQIQIVSSPEVAPIVGDAQGILALGSEPLAVMMALAAVPKNRTITSLRNQMWKLPGGNPLPLMFSYSAGIHEIDYGKYVDLQTDANAMLRLVTTGSNAPKMGNYRYIHDLSNILLRIDELHAKTGKPVPATLDLETIGLDPRLLPMGTHPGARIVCMQFTVEEGKSDVVYFESMVAFQEWWDNFDNKVMLTEFLTSPKISLGGANLKYDLHWIAVHCGIQCTNFKFDTTLVGSLLDENRSNGLDIHAKIYTPMGGYSDEFDRTIDKSRMDLVPKDQMLPYAGGDTDACYQVRQAMQKDLLADKELTRFYVNILHPAARAFEQVEQGGVCVDMEAYKELENDLNTEIDQLLIKGKKLLGGRIVAKHTDLDKRGGLNLTKASLLTDFMFSPMGLNLTPKVVTAKTGAPSTAMDHLLLFKDVPEAADFVALLSDFSSATKTMGTYVTGFQKHIRSDGRFHPSYWFFAGNKDEGEGGTVTGRLSCKDPAFQTIPKHTKWAKPLRKCFVAPEGYLVLENDYSQGELRVIACIANEANMIQAYMEGKDLHAVTSGRFAGYDYEQMMELKINNPELFDKIRQLGKAGNFGLIYGMGAEGFNAYAETNYGVKLTMEESNNFRNSFFDTYSSLPDYHKEYKAHAHKYGYVRSPLGRIRHLPLIDTPNREMRSGAERQAINSPVQSALSDMMLWCAAIANKRGWFKETPMFGCVHDAKYTYVPEDNWEFYAAREKELMENLPFHEVGWNPQLQFTADGKIGKNMAKLSAIK